MKMGLFSLVTLALHGIGSLGFVPGVPGISWEFLFFLTNLFDNFFLLIFFFDDFFQQIFLVFFF